MWHFFEPPAGGGNNEYVYAANRLQLGVRRSAPRFDLTAALQYVQFAGLPADAAGPGPLGLGAVYFAHAGRSDSHQVYLRYLNLRVKDLLPGLSVQAGRMPYSSGGESASGNPKIEAVKRQRVDARLVGEFEWSIYQRAYDGVRLDLTRPGWSSTVLGFRPTQGGFEDAAGASMSEVTVLGGNATIKPRVFRRGVEWQAFGFRYLDDRNVAARPDNSGRPAERVDVAINTFGTTVVAASEPRTGRQWDALMWIVGQTGSWFEQTHRASSVSAEIGYQWTMLRWRPWLRIGILRASGDDDPEDDRHGTFFQMLPTVRRYSQTAAYSQMNNTDLFAQILLRPTDPLAIRVDLHRVGLASPRDLWYFGSGRRSPAERCWGSRPDRQMGRRISAPSSKALPTMWCRPTGRSAPMQVSSAVEVSCADRLRAGRWRLAFSRVPSSSEERGVMRARVITCRGKMAATGSAAAVVLWL